MGSEWFSPFSMHFCPFSTFFTHFSPFSSLFSASPKGQGQTKAIYCKNGEFSSDPVCTDPVQNFPIFHITMGTHWQFRIYQIRASPEKSDSASFRVRTKEENFSELCVCCFCLKKVNKMLPPKKGLVNQFSATPRGQLNWASLIANSSEQHTVEFAVSTLARVLVGKSVKPASYGLYFRWDGSSLTWFHE